MSDIKKNALKTQGSINMASTDGIKKSPVTNTKIAQKHLVKDIADSLNMSQNDVDRVIDSFIHIVSEHMHQRKDVRLTGLGIFSTRDRKAGTARNPATGKEIQVQASVVPTFRPATQLREKLRESVTNRQDV